MSFIWDKFNLVWDQQCVLPRWDKRSESFEKFTEIIERVNFRAATSKSTFIPTSPCKSMESLGFKALVMLLSWSQPWRSVETIFISMIVYWHYFLLCFFLIITTNIRVVPQINQISLFSRHKLLETHCFFHSENPSQRIRIHSLFDTLTTLNRMLNFSRMLLDCTAFLRPLTAISI